MIPIEVLFELILKELRCESERTSINDDQGLNDIGRGFEDLKED